ncbi:unnamed protein product [Leptidea sinapis]|uniref:Uncharacterized protein n=1 Tax=Leptidea sinapis TaxID=189913 RepID=A0A5E4QUE9_9NEOP|nr:unnamed protein product [Leptidea sinapis]
MYRGSLRHPNKKDDHQAKSKDMPFEVEDYPPKAKRLLNKSQLNRSCDVSPVTKDQALSTENVAVDQYQKLLMEQYGFDPVSQDKGETILFLKDHITFDSNRILPEHIVKKRINFGDVLKVDNEAQYTKLLKDQSVSYEDITCWQNVENADDIENIFCTENAEIPMPRQIEICNIPTVKVVAEKYAKYKKNEVEVRKTEEKIVCLEYDVLPKYGKISENRLYLEDLRRILRHKQNVYVKKNKASLDLMCLYRMAKKQKPVECSSTNVLSKNELEEIKNLIKDKCTSSMHGIERHRIKSESKRNKTMNVVSESIFAEIVKSLKTDKAAAHKNINVIAL